MAWNDKPPTKEELKSSWSDVPPTDKELGKSAPISQLESFLRGGAQGASLGFAPALVGAAESAPTALKAVTGNASMEDLLQAYKKSRDASNANFQASEKANPGSYLAGGIAGGVALAPLLPEAAGALGAAKLGAGIGAASGLGQSVSEGSDLSQTGKNVALQGLTGGALGGALGKLTSLLAPESLENAASRQALKATGITKSQAKKLGSEKALEQGANLLNKNEFTESPVISAMASPEDMLENATTLKENSGKAIGSMLEQLDTAAQNNQELSDKLVDPKKITNYIDELKKQYLLNGEPSEALSSAYNQLDNVSKDIAKFGEDPVDFSTANRIKQYLSSLAYNDSGNVINKDMANIRGFTNDLIETSADDITKSLGDPDLASKYAKAKDLYGTASTAIDSLKGKTAQNLVNRDLGITDYMSGIVGAATHGLSGAAVGSGINVLAKKYGNTLAATGLKNTANGLTALGKTFTSIPKESYKVIGTSLMKSEDKSISSLGKLLSSAADKDEIGRNAIIFSLLQNPEYRDLMKQLVKE